MHRFAVIAVCAAALAAPAGAAASVSIATLTSPVARGSGALLVARVSPGRPLCTISLASKNGVMRSKALAPKRPNSGILTWDWIVPETAKPGDYRLVVSCGKAGRLLDVLTVGR
jgi:hypothetical protein